MGEGLKARTANVLASSLREGRTGNQQRKFWRRARTVTESPQLARPVGEPSLVRWASDWAGEWARMPTRPLRERGRPMAPEFETRTSFDWTAPRQTQLSLSSGQWVGAGLFAGPPSACSRCIT
jgi:hypothetical protein